MPKNTQQSESPSPTEVIDMTGEAVQAELARLREERDRAIAEANEAKKAAASGGTKYEAGQRYRVSVKDGPTWVVEIEDGEHPFEAYKRATGMLHANHPPVVTPTDEPVGRVV